MICLWNSRYSFFTSFELIELSTPTSSILVIVSRIKYKTIRNDTNACSIAHKFQQSISHVFRSKKMLHAFVEIPFGSARFGCKTGRGREVAERRAGTIRIGSSQQWSKGWKGRGGKQKRDGSIGQRAGRMCEYPFARKGGRILAAWRRMAVAPSPVNTDESQ